MNKDRKWDGIITAFAVKHVEVTAPNRKEAERRINDICSEYVVGYDVTFDERSRRILREVKNDPDEGGRKGGE